MNPWAGWLFIIGTPARARKLRALLGKLSPATIVTEPVYDDDGFTIGTADVYTPPMCPTQVLFGQREAAKLYADPLTRPALDAWDQQFLTKDDIRRLCQEIEHGGYRGQVYEPDVRKVA